MARGREASGRADRASFRFPTILNGRSSSMSLLKPLVAMTAAMMLCAGIGCSTAPKTEAKQENLQDQAQTTVDMMKRTDPGLADTLGRSYGYAIFPSVGKGGVIVGGAYGKGVVYEQGDRVGYADLTQATVGAQLGGQTFAELIVFQNREAMERFKNNQLAFAANASAVALKKGAAASARYENGVLVFTQPNGGLMFEASVGGQKFTYVSDRDTSNPATRATMTQ
jgi:lipid-binding SYLF domain-containing protein